MTSGATRRRAIALQWQDLPRWDFKTARAALFRKAHPAFNPLSTFAEEITELVRPWEEPDKDWPVYGINNQVGVFLSHYQKGREFNATYKRIRRDWFFHNPTRANVGSLGRVLDAPPDAITSPEYQVWRTKPGLLPAFMEIVLQMDFFADQIECHRVGGVKQRLFAQNLLEIPIPVLSESEQLAIIGEWNTAQNELARTQTAIKDLLAGLDNRILHVLGINLLKPTPRRGAFALDWGTFERWDTFFYRHDFLALQSQLSRLAARPLGQVAHFVTRPWQRSGFPDGKFRYVEIGAVNREEGIVACREVEVEDAPSRATTIIRTSDILISTTRPYLGAFALVPPEYDKCVCTSGFAVIDHVTEPILDRDFLLLFLKSSAGLRQMERRMTGGLYPAIVQPELEKIQIPLLSYADQESLVRTANDVRRQVEKEKNIDEARAAMIKSRLEEMILGVRRMPR